jgi:hypothetical protein
MREVKIIKITRHMFNHFNNTLTALGTGRMTALELAAAINATHTTMGNIICEMVKKRYIEKHRIEGVARRFEYSALVPLLDESCIRGAEDVPKKEKAEVVVNPYAKLVTFNTDEMHKKLFEQDRLNKAERRRASTFIASSMEMV